MGKYSHLVGKVEAAPVKDQSWQQKVDKERADNVPPNTEIMAVAEQWRYLKKEKQDLEDEIAKLNIRLEARTQYMIDWLENNGMDKFTMSGGGTFYIKDEPTCSVKDRVAFRKWVDEQGLSEMLTMNYNTMNGMVKKRLIAGQPMPDGVEAFMLRKMGTLGVKGVRADADKE